MRKILYILCAAAALAGCYKVDIHDTDHPKTGKLTLTIDWSARTQGIAVPAQYTVECVDPSGKVTLSGTTVEYPNLFTPGTYTLNLYNTADKITVNGTVATAAWATPEISAAAADDIVGDVIVVYPQPGFQFWGSITKTIEADKDYAETVAMQQITRQLAFELTVAEGEPERIRHIEAYLSGVAHAWDMAANTPSGAAAIVAPTFTREGNKLIAAVRLLGVTGAVQTLTLELSFSDGRSQTIVSDVSSQLTTFNNDKKTPLTLSGNVNTPIASDQNGTITGWIPVSGGGIIDIY